MYKRLRQIGALLFVVSLFTSFVLLAAIVVESIDLEKEMFISLGASFIGMFILGVGVWFDDSLGPYED